jgi:hypothetical protein
VADVVDRDPAFYLNADPDPDPGIQTNAVPALDPGQRVKFFHKKYTFLFFN